MELEIPLDWISLIRLEVPRVEGIFSCFCGTHHILALNGHVTW